MTTNKTLSNILLIVSVETGISEEDIKGKILTKMEVV